MQQYIGTKIIQAEPQEIDGRQGYKVRYPDGYTSWSPKDAFEAAYRLTDGMNFGLALDALKIGKKVARRGWNGKGMFLWMNPGAFDASPEIHPSSIEGVHISLFDKCGEGVSTRLPNINMRAASGATVTGWLASQTDMLADDWLIVE